MAFSKDKRQQEQSDKIQKTLEINQDLLERAIHIEQKEDQMLDTMQSLHYNSASVMAERYSRRSWSQHGEDLLIWDLFRRKGTEKPTYLDIGANHPFMISNTAIFNVNACRGINIDASPFNIENFNIYRPEDVNLCCGVGAENGEMTFYMVDKWSGRNSFNKSAVESFVKENPQFSITETIEVPVRKLNDILDEHWGGTIPDYVSIDIEGSEYDVLKNFDLNKYRPKVITIEINPDNDHLKEKLFELMDKSEFVLYLVTGVNYTFISKEFKESS